MLTRETASAPAAAAASAIEAIEVTFGVNLAITGCRVAARTRDQFRRQLRVRPKVDATAHIGAGDVEFKCRDSRKLVQTPGERDKLVGITSRNIDDQRRPQAHEPVEMLFDKRIEPVVVESNRIEHSAGGLERARRRIAEARKGSHRLRNDAAETRQPDKRLHLAPVTEGPRRDQNGIRQLQAIQRDSEPAHQGD